VVATQPNIVFVLCGIDQPIVTPQWPMLFDLASDPGEL
jgi:hypothetical protein